MRTTLEEIPTQHTTGGNHHQKEALFDGQFTEFPMTHEGLGANQRLALYLKPQKKERERRGERKKT